MRNVGKTKQTMLATHYGHRTEVQGGLGIDFHNHHGAGLDLTISIPKHLPTQDFCLLYNFPYLRPIPTSNFTLLYKSYVDE